MTTLPTFQKARAVLGSTSRAIELLLLLSKEKPAVRWTIHRQEESRIRSFASLHGIECAVSQFGIALDPSESYPTKGRRVPAQHATFTLLYLSLSNSPLDHLLSAEEHNDHERVGRILGYPSCCIDFFKKNELRESQKKNDFITPALLETPLRESYPFFLNIFGRYVDAILLSHAPCSLVCENSRRSAKQHFSCLKDKWPDCAAHIKEMLLQPVLYADDVVITLHNSWISENMIYYDSVSGSTNHYLVQAAANERYITIPERDSIHIGSRSVQGRLFLFTD